MDPCQLAQKGVPPLNNRLTNSLPNRRHCRYYHHHHSSLHPGKETENVVEGEKRTFWGDCGQGRDARSRADYK